jgi:hypothetical protein
VDRVILSADTVKQELFYVGASRGRSEIAIVTSAVNNCANRSGSLPCVLLPPSSLGNKLNRASLSAVVNQLRFNEIEPPTPRHEISVGHDMGSVSELLLQRN